MVKYHLVIERMYDLTEEEVKFLKRAVEFLGVSDMYRFVETPTRYHFPLCPLGYDCIPLYPYESAFINTRDFTKIYDELGCDLLISHDEHSRTLQLQNSC